MPGVTVLKRLDKLNSRELDQVIMRANSLKLERRHDDKIAARAEIDALLKTRGFSIKDVLSKHVLGRRVNGRPARFANPKDRTQTWTGRGRHPKWYDAKTAIAL